MHTKSTKINLPRNFLALRYLNLKKCYKDMITAHLPTQCWYLWLVDFLPNSIFHMRSICCTDLSGDLMFDAFWEAIAQLERQGFHVLAVTCDGASTNCHLWKLHANNNEVIHKIPNVYAAEGSRDIYFISDPPHLLKMIRNSWYNRAYG